MGSDGPKVLTNDADGLTEVLPEINLPGLSELREVVANYALKQLPRRATVVQDGLAGLNSALASVPDGLASGAFSFTNKPTTMEGLR